jgi:hypothetical protein
MVGITWLTYQLVRFVAPLQLGDYTDGGLLDAALNDLAAAVGGDAVFGLLVGGGVLFSFYLASDGGLATPSVLTALAGGVLFGTLPGGFARIAQVIIFVGLVGAIFGLLDKFVDQTP